MTISNTDKQRGFYGSTRFYANSITLGSTANFTFYNFSGAFGPADSSSDIYSRRVAYQSSGNSVAEFMPFSGAQIEQIWAGAAKAFDGLQLSGVWLRSSAASQVIQINAW